MSDPGEPKNYKAATQGKNKEEWTPAIKSEIENFFTIKELGILSKHLGVWYKWAEDDHGRNIESSMETFVKGMIDDSQSLFGRLPKIAATPGLPEIGRAHV